jgi:PAS domain-containing protein
MKSTIEAAAPLRHYKKMNIICLHHAGAAVATTATLPSATVTIGRACTFAATPRGLAMPAGALAMSDVRGVRGRKGEQSNGEAVWNEGARTHETLRLVANSSSIKRRAPGADLSKLTAEEQGRWKRAQARQHSASARQKQVDRERNLRDQMEALSISQVLIEAAPDAVLLLSPDGQARILFVNDRCSHLLWPGSLRAKGQALVGRSLWEWMDAQDKAAVSAVIGVCFSCKNVTRRAQCTLYSPRSPFALQPGGTMQQLGNQKPQHYQQQQ